MTSLSEAEAAVQYPTAVDSSDGLQSPGNSVATILVSDITSGQTSITIASAAGLQATNGLVSIGNEVVRYSYIDLAGPNPVLASCTRGADGTTAAPHLAAAVVEVRSIAGLHNLLQVAVRRLETELGIAPRGSYVDVAARLNGAQPVVYYVTTPAAVWTVVHSKARPVGAQLWWEIAPDVYEFRTDAAVSQDASTSTVTITWNDTLTHTGYVVIF